MGDGPGVTIRFRVGAPLAAFALWAILTALYVQATWGTFSAENLAKVAIPMAGACVALYMAWHNTDISKRERQRAEERHAELMGAQRLQRAFEILRTLDEQDRVALRVEIRKECEPLQGNLDLLKAKLNEKPELDTNVSKVLGCFEDMALAVRLGHADEAALYYSMSGIITRYFKMFRAHIEDQRALRGAASAMLYCEIEYVAARWAKAESVQNKGQKFPDIYA